MEKPQLSAKLLSQKPVPLQTDAQRKAAVRAAWHGFYETYKGPAATIIQAHWRGYALRKLLHAQRHGRLIRGLPKRHKKTRDTAARVIQRWVRGWLGRRQAAEARASAITIQRWWKGFSERQKYPALRRAWRKRNDAATEIQRYVRGYLARVRHGRQQPRSAFVASRWGKPPPPKAQRSSSGAAVIHMSPSSQLTLLPARPGLPSKPKQLLFMSPKDHAASIIQAQYRGWKARKRLVWLKKEAQRAKAYRAKLLARAESLLATTSAAEAPKEVVSKTSSDFLSTALNGSTGHPISTRSTTGQVSPVMLLPTPPDHRSAAQQDLSLQQALCKETTAATRIQASFRGWAARKLAAALRHAYRCGLLPMPPHLVAVAGPHLRLYVNSSSQRPAISSHSLLPTRQPGQPTVSTSAAVAGVHTTPESTASSSGHLLKRPSLRRVTSPSPPSPKSDPAAPARSTAALRPLKLQAKAEASSASTSATEALKGAAGLSSSQHLSKPNTSALPLQPKSLASTSVPVPPGGTTAAAVATKPSVTSSGISSTGSDLKHPRPKPPGPQAPARPAIQMSGSLQARSGTRSVNGSVSSSTPASLTSTTESLVLSGSDSSSTAGGANTSSESSKAAKAALQQVPVSASSPPPTGVSVEPPLVSYPSPNLKPPTQPRPANMPSLKRSLSVTTASSISRNVRAPAGHTTGGQAGTPPKIKDKAVGAANEPSSPAGGTASTTNQVESRKRSISSSVGLGRQHQQRSPGTGSRKEGGMVGVVGSQQSQLRRTQSDRMAGQDSTSSSPSQTSSELYQSLDVQRRTALDNAAGVPGPIGKHNVIHAVVMGGKRHTSFKHK